MYRVYKASVAVQLFDVYHQKMHKNAKSIVLVTYYPPVFHDDQNSGDPSGPTKIRDPILHEYIPYKSIMWVNFSLS